MRGPRWLAAFGHPKRASLPQPRPASAAVPHFAFFRSNQIVAAVGARPTQNNICGTVRSVHGTSAISSPHSSASAAYARTIRDQAPRRNTERTLSCTPARNRR